MASFDYSKGSLDYSKGSFNYGSTGAGFSGAGALGVAGGVLNIFGSVASLFGSRQEAKARKAYQEYANKMVHLSNSVNQNAITLNEIMYNVASADKSVYLKRQGLSDVAIAEASAAAAGVKGKSVDVALNNLRGASLKAEENRARDFKYAMLDFNYKRQHSAMAAVMMQDQSKYSSGGSSIGTLFEIGKSAIDILGVLK